MHDPDTRHQWVSVKQAAIHFGTSESDIRRRIRRGELTSESLSRPGGTLLRVRLPAPDDAPDTHHAAPLEATREPEARQDLSAALSAALGPLTEALALERAERQTLAQENATLRERAARAEARAEMLADDLERSRRPWWRRLTGW